MGNVSTKKNDDKLNPDKIVGKDAANDLKKIYWDNDGNLRHGNTTRNRDEELMQLLQSDVNDDKDETKLWMIIPSRWIKEWLIFTHLKLGEPPGPIDMFSLLQKDLTVEGGWRPKKTLLPPSINPDPSDPANHPGHYRRVTLQAWINLIDLYGVKGYALCVRGIPHDDLTRWRVFKNVRVIDINLLPEPIIQEKKEEKKEEKKSIFGF